MTMILCIMTSLIVLGFLLAPFFLGEGGRMVAHSALSTEQSLENLQENLLANYLKCEELFEKKQLSKREWEQRQIFLTNRYLDSTRRLDAMRFQKVEIISADECVQMHQRLEKNSQELCQELLHGGRP